MTSSPPPRRRILMVHGVQHGHHPSGLDTAATVTDKKLRDLVSAVLNP